MNTRNITEIRPHHIPRKDVQDSIHINNGDHTILRVYKKVLKAPIRAVLRLMARRLEVPIYVLCEHCLQLGLVEVYTMEQDEALKAGQVSAIY